MHCFKNNKKEQECELEYNYKISYIRITLWNLCVWSRNH